MERLAVEGGQPVRDDEIWYGRQWIDEKDISAVGDVLRSPLITSGPNVEQLEKRLAEYTGARYAVAVSSGTAALHCACLAAGIKDKDEVITTPLTFAASANCIRYCGGVPVFADVDPDTYNIDPQSIKKHITEKTKAVIAVDFTGQSVELDRLLSHCRANHMVLIEDGAHVIGTRYKGRCNGSIADMTTFSFHPVKTVTSGEGGAVLTDNEEYYRKLLLYRAHGITRDPGQMSHEPEGPWYYEQVALGMNYRMTDIQAALLISQLDKLPVFSQRRKEIVKAYDSAFAGLPQLVVQKEIPESDTTRHLYILRLNPHRLRIGRKEFFEALGAENICCNVHYIPTYYFPYYEKLGYQRGICPKAEKLYEEMISLPLYYAMTDQDVQDVARAVTRIAEFYGKGPDEA